MESSALTHAPVQRRCAVSKARSRLRRPSSVPRVPQWHVVQRRSVAVGSALLDVDWSQLSRLLLAPMLSAAAIRKATDSLSKRAAVDEVCRAFQVQDKEELQVSSGLLVGCVGGLHCSTSALLRSCVAETSSSRNVSRASTAVDASTARHLETASFSNEQDSVLGAAAGQRLWVCQQVVHTTAATP